MIESIERMCKLVNDNLVMGLRFQMNRELNKLESEIKQEFNSQAERIYVLEELAVDLYADLMEYGCTPNAHRAGYRPRFEALGIEVSEYETELPDWLIDESDD